MPHQYAHQFLYRTFRFTRPVLAATVLTAALAAGACASKPPPDPVVSDQVQQVTALVEAIDPATRTVRLKAAEGSVDVVLGPEVRNFDQIRVGDTVKATYYTGIAAEISKHDGEAPPPTDEIALAQAKPGTTPAAGVAHNMSATVTIVSVDQSFDTVTFTLPSGDERVVAVQTPEGREFIRSLKKGDKVDVTYTEAVAVEVVPNR